MFKRHELRDAVRTWLEHRGWAVSSMEEVGGTVPDVLALRVVARKDSQSVAWLVLQHSVWFDPLDYDDGFLVPANDLTSRASEVGRHAILCFNNCRAYAVFIDASSWSCLTEVAPSRFMLHADDVNHLAVPWRLWAIDALPEWLQRGWPNPMTGRRGKVGERSSWQFHPNWHEDVMRLAETYKRLPTSVEEATFTLWRSARWYRAFLETHDDLILPWAEVEPVN